MLIYPILLPFDHFNACACCSVLSVFIPSIPDKVSPDLYLGTEIVVTLRSNAYVHGNMEKAVLGTTQTYPAGKRN